MWSGTLLFWGRRQGRHAAPSCHARVLHLLSSSRTLAPARDSHSLLMLARPLDHKPQAKRLAVAAGHSATKMTTRHADVARVLLQARHASSRPVLQPVARQDHVTPGPAPAAANLQAAPLPSLAPQVSQLRCHTLSMQGGCMAW